MFLSCLFVFPCQFQQKLCIEAVCYVKLSGIHSFRSSIQIKKLSFIMSVKFGFFNFRFSFFKITFFLKNYFWWEGAPCWSQEMVKRPFLNAIACLQNNQSFSVRWGFWKNFGEKFEEILRNLQDDFRNWMEVSEKFSKLQAKSYVNYKENFKILWKNLENFDYLIFKKLRAIFANILTELKDILKVRNFFLNLKIVRKFFVKFMEN